MPSPAVIHVAVQPVSYTEYKRIGVRAVQCRSATGSAAVRAVLSIYPSFCVVVCLFIYLCALTIPKAGQPQSALLPNTSQRE
jgi:hypothetical protein